ncbi:signal recognition particle-docking protein FtsY [Tsukamurella sp. 8F]|uniref:signal recognition particle-docking protein FtsY n=1 Tax=unclassified Tsukamurella TaxID=2633480 RepID=UPI0023B9D249|nr:MULTISPECIES: signal recognition particle-docking protein FtsY [unclassified Tsukamurella]MDF0531234.1 signal recognition particle-docking protein FtsY [Tsukamurella sp. 8J]MDF0588503.1 signal recognition particle-docking protein FtsY [Tsukamurella sp. 8F]
MSATGIWIIVAVVVVLVLLAALTTGLYLNKRRRVSLKDEPAEPKSLDKSGGYKAGGGFSFSEGPGAKEPEPVTRPETPQPKRETKASEFAPEATGAEEPERTAQPEAEPVTDLDETPAEAVEETDETRVDAEESVGADVAPEAEAVEAEAAQTVEPEAAAPEAAAPGTVEPEAAAPGTVEPEVAAPAPRLDEIEPTAGRMNRLKGRLARSQSTVGASLLGLLGAGDLDEESWEEIEDTLLMADLGTATTLKVTEALREEIAANGVADAKEARERLRKVLIAELHPELDRSIRALPHAGAPSVLLVVGVNGTGKTTTTGKLARVLVADGRRVLLGAADTFRAAAADQLQTWAERVGAEVVRGKEGADPAAVGFDAVDRGTEQGVDVVLIDTAGRLHTKTGLMDELGKVKRVVEKKAKVDEVLLVLDATIGQNGLSQAKVFREVVDITGVVLTKLDGTAKGGIVYAVQHELGVPVKLVGLGEGADDLAPFEPSAFVDALLG